MFLPAFEEGRGKLKKLILDFKGLNLSDNYAEGQIEDCNGISLSEYPQIVAGRAVKSEQREEDKNEDVHGIYERDGLVIVKNGKVYFKEEHIGDISPGAKSFCGINSKIVILPDKMYFDIFKNNKLLYLNSEITVSGKFEGGAIIADGGGDKFSAGDAVEISGSAEEGNNKSAIIREIEDNTFIFDSDIFTATEEAETLKIERKMPNLQLMCESGNRIWGVDGNTIYASKLGDPTNFKVYDGLSTDSYSVAVASPGEFTAVCGYGNRVLFFKEDCVHVIYGTKPSNYQLYTYNIPGVMKGAEKSLQIIDEILYYKGRDGIYAYSSGAARLISEELGAEKYEGGVSGKDGDTYFIGLTKNGKDTLFSYDTKKGFWLKELDISVSDIVFSDNRLLFVSENRLYSFSTENNEDIEWSITFKPFSEYADEKKIYSSLFLRYETEGVMRVFTSCDGGVWEEVELLWKKNRKTTFIPIYPQRCDSFKIKICGRGKFKIKSLSREYSVGGDER